MDRVQEITARYAAQRAAIRVQSNIEKRRIAREHRAKLASMRVEFGKIKAIQAIVYLAVKDILLPIYSLLNPNLFMDLVI